ncbi:MAG TPA: TonB-dependent receptor plug domain-containing protein, partial [Parasegetibacter sp.]
MNLMSWQSFIVSHVPGISVKKWMPLFMFMLIVAAQSDAQIIKGRLLSSGEPVPGATVTVKGTGRAVVSDDEARFAIEAKVRDTLVITAVGFQLTEWVIRNNGFQEIPLVRESDLMGEVVVSGTLKEVKKLASPILVETYSASFFKKNPVPNLFESLGTLNGVQPQINCNVCNTGDIHINGMEGPYTMVLIDGMPIVSSLSTVYGLMGIPSSLIKRIEIVK